MTLLLKFVAGMPVYHLINSLVHASHVSRPIVCEVGLYPVLYKIHTHCSILFPSFLHILPFSFFSFFELIKPVFSSFDLSPLYLILLSLLHSFILYLRLHFIFFYSFCFRYFRLLPVVM